MRFVLAIVAFVLAAVLIGAGVLQRTVFAPPSSLTLTAPVPEEETPYTVVTSRALTAHPGAQTLDVRGSEQIYVAYARGADVRAWLGDATYSIVEVDPETGELTTQTITGDPAPVSEAAAQGIGETLATAAEPSTSPIGSDLWLGDYTGENALIAVMNVPPGIVALVTTDGTAPAPTQISLSWPLDRVTPLVGPLLLSGMILLLAGLVLLAWGLLHHRRSRGPRRRSLPPGASASRRPGLGFRPRPRAVEGSRSERRALRRALPAVVLPALLLGGCSAEYWPQPEAPVPTTAAPTPEASSTAAPTEEEEEAPPPAIGEVQAERIIADVAARLAVADETRNAEEAAVRLSGPALQARQAEYAIRGVVADYVGGVDVPAADPALTLPQASQGWPKSVLTVVEGADEAVPPTVAVMTQTAPREPYTVPYLLSLFDTIPDVAPAAVGAPPIAPDSKLLLLPPQQVAQAYGDILSRGAESEYFSLFQEEGDDFRAAYGVEAKNAQRAAVPATAALEFAVEPGTGPLITLATNDSGALVAVSLTEKEVIKPVETGATVSQNGAAPKALSGVDVSTKGIETVYGDQLLFYVPPAGSDQKIVLLGYSQGLISSSEIP